MKPSKKLTLLITLTLFGLLCNDLSAQLNNEELKAILQMEADLIHCHRQQTLNEEKIQSLVVVRDLKDKVIENQHEKIQNAFKETNLYRAENSALKGQVVTLEDENGVLKIKTKLFTIAIPIAFVGGVYVGYQVFK